MDTRKKHWSRTLLINLALLTALSGGLALSQKGGKPGGGGGGGSTPPYDPAIAYATWSCSGGNLYAMNADGSNKTLLAQAGGHPAWIPGSSWLVFNHAGAQGEGLYVIDAHDPQTEAKVADSSGCVEFLLVNPVNPNMIAWVDPQQLAGGGWSSEVFFTIQDPVGGWNTLAIDTFLDLLLPGAWSPDGTRLAAMAWDSATLRSKGGFIYEVVYDAAGLPTALNQIRDVTSGMTAQGWDMEHFTDWSGGSGRWLLIHGSQGTEEDDVFLVDLDSDPPVFHNLTNNPKVAHRNAKWSPCGDRVVIEQVEKSGHKLAVCDLSFDASGDFLGVTGSSLLPASKREVFFWADWRPAAPGECPAP